MTECVCVSACMCGCDWPGSNKLASKFKYSLWFAYPPLQVDKTTFFPLFEYTHLGFGLGASVDFSKLTRNGSRCCPFWKRDIYLFNAQSTMTVTLGQIPFWNTHTISGTTLGSYQYQSVFGELFTMWLGGGTPLADVFCTFSLYQCVCLSNAETKLCSC